MILGVIHLFKSRGTDESNLINHLRVQPHEFFDLSFFFIQNFGRAIIPMFVGKANETDPTYETSMLIFGFTALGAALTAMAMWYVDRRQGYGLQLPNIRK